MSESRGSVAEQFEDRSQQEEAAKLGMWAFLATEVLFFGGLFMSYITYRSLYPQAFAEAGRHTLVLFGSVNSAILLTSSFTMTLAVQAARLGQNRSVWRLLMVTILLGLCFLAIKGLEYHNDLKEHLLPGATFRSDLPRAGEMFWYLYWAMTGLHSVHVVIGLGVLFVIALYAWKGRYSAEYHTPVTVSGMYWHFVDVIWIFLYPLLYLLGRHP